MADEVKPLAQFGSLVLTENRVQRVTDLEIGSALLSEVNAVTTKHKHSPAFILLAFLLLVGGILLGKMSHGLEYLIPGGIVGATGCVAAYFLTRKTLLTVFAGGAEISTEIGGGGFKKAAEFIDAVEAAKVRYESVPRASS